MQLIIIKNSNGRHEKGDIVDVYANDTSFSEVMAGAYVLVKVPNALMAGFRDKRQAWYSELGFDVVADNVSLDGYRIRVYTTNASSVKGSITREQVEAHISKWNGIVHSVGTNEVQFDVTISGALMSEAFWDRPVNDMVFQELSYDTGTGVHRIQNDYSAFRDSPTAIETRVETLGLEIISHNNKVIVYEGERDDVKTKFQEYIKQKGRSKIAYSRYHVSETVVDNIISQGGIIETDATTLMSYIQDKIAE